MEDCAHGHGDRVREALRVVGGLLGATCAFSRALTHLEVLLRARERSMDPRLVTRDIAFLVFALVTCRDRAKRHKVEFYIQYYQLHGAPLEGVHLLGFDYYYAQDMEVS